MFNVRKVPAVIFKYFSKRINKILRKFLESFTLYTNTLGRSGENNSQNQI